MGLFWGLGTAIDAYSAVLFLASAAVLVLSYLQGVHVNMLSDYAIDRNYKRFLPDAIDALGRNTFKVIFLIECIAAFFLVLFLSIWLGKAVLLVLWLIGVMIGLAYSLEPLRLKSNPVLNMTSLILVLCIFPMVWVYFMFASSITVAFGLFCVGMALGVIGFVVPTELEDYPEDKEARIRTLTQVLGPHRASILAILATAASLSITSAGAGLEFLATQRPWFWLPANLVMTITYGFTIWKLMGLQSVCKQFEKADQNGKEMLMVEIKMITARARKQWFGLVGWSGLFAGFLLYLSRILM
jgi:4-hydroxybenzoate polyprenyltransferase